MSSVIKVLFFSAVLTICANAQAASGTLTVWADSDPMVPAGFTNVGYCRSWGVCAYCDHDWDPSCQQPVYYGYGSISNQYLSDGKEVIVVSENGAPGQLKLFINTGSNPGSSYITNISINCNGGTRNWSSVSNTYVGGGWHTVYVSTTSQCMTAGNTYTITVS